jgi:hypothetical protein
VQHSPLALTFVPRPKSKYQFQVGTDLVLKRLRIELIPPLFAFILSLGSFKFQLELKKLGIPIALVDCVKLSWFKKLLLVTYIFGVIAVSIQLTSKSMNQIDRQSDKKNGSLAKSEGPQNQSSIQTVNFRN